jgi:NAD(P)-dependent dehydrogenase (short-subunit alcohol dehydrogenase family)
VVAPSWAPTSVGGEDELLVAALAGPGLGEPLNGGQWTWDASARYPNSTSRSAPGHPEAIAAAAVYLASDEAAFVHGAVLDIDGGRVNVLTSADAAAVHP